jgi:glycerol-3-phosphate dehydrogenase
MTISEIETRWDVIIIGGGITGAGIFREAAQMGLSVLLLEQRDFAWGTSSRSSKMVHGGLRYLIEGKLRLSLASVKERQRLLLEAPGLVDPLDFVTPVYGSHGPSKRVLGTALFLYSLMARKKQHTALSPDQTRERVPLIRTEDLEAGFCFRDAQADDARLVLRLIAEGRAKGGTALNYTKVCSIERAGRGRVAAVMAEDAETEESAELEATVVINATGAWAEGLHPSPVEGLHLRPLRGSHLIFPGELFNLDAVLSFFHPADNRPVFLYPWEGCLILGTTDMDHVDPLDGEPSISQEEVDYLMEGLRFVLPSSEISEKDCISSIAGVRPVLSRGRKAASKESRDHVVWDDRGLITVTGGKLTTFRLIAQDALTVAERYLRKLPISKKSSIFDQPVIEAMDNERLQLFSQDVRKRLYGRYGSMAEVIMGAQEEEDRSTVPGTSTLWCEMAFAARHEHVRHLSDLLLRRVRIGLLLPGGGEEHLGRLEKLCRSALSWSDGRWNEEKKQYLEEWRSCYAPPFDRVI